MSADGRRLPGLARVAFDVLRSGERHRYGEHRWAQAELHRPRASGRVPVVVLLHGGSWRAGYSKVLMRPLCRDLVRRGWAAWNVEYRRMGGGQGGGWPSTFEDVAAAVAHLGELDAELDLDRVVLLGHSAGGHLAMWAAGLQQRAPQAIEAGLMLEWPAGVRLRAVVGQAPVANLERGSALIEPGGLVHALLGGTPEQVPGRYEAANPLRQVPLDVPALLVHGANDSTVSVGHSRDYAQAARAAGASVEVVEPTRTSHRDHIDPRSDAWAAVTARLDALVA